MDCNKKCKNPNEEPVRKYSYDEVIEKSVDDIANMITSLFKESDKERLNDEESPKVKEFSKILSECEEALKQFCDKGFKA